MPASKVERAQKACLVWLTLIIFALFFVGIWRTHNIDVRQANSDTNQASDNQREHESMWHPSTWEPVTSLTFVLAVATTGLWIYTASLWGATKRLVIGAEDTAQRQLRAYIYLDHLATKVDMQNNFIVTPIWKNCGLTPAKSIQYYTQSYFDCRVSTPERVGFPILKVDPGSNQIGPGGVIKGPPTERVVPQYFAAADYFICFYGAIDYKDVFDHVRRTEFSYKITIDPLMAVDPYIFGLTSKHNGADEDCMYEAYAQPGDKPRRA